MHAHGRRRRYTNRTGHAGEFLGGGGAGKDTLLAFHPVIYTMQGVVLGVPGLGKQQRR